MNIAQTIQAAATRSRHEPVVAIEPRAAYELLMTLMAVADPTEQASYEIGPEWFARVREEADPDLISRIERLSAGCSWIFGNVLGLAIETPEPRDGQALVDHLAGLDDRRIHLMLLGQTLRPFRRVTPPDVIEAAADGDTDARRRFLATSFPDHPTWPGAVRRLLDLGQAESAALLRGIIGDWLSRVFTLEGGPLMSVIERDADELRASLAVMSPAELIDRATRGWDYVPEPGVGRVVLAPSMVGRPFVTTADHGDTRIFCTSVADESVVAAAGDDPPAFLVRRLRALGDERRLRLLRRIHEGRIGLQELAAEFGLPKTTLHHHLAVLRSAGLIRLRDDPARQYSPYSRYDFRAEAIPGTWQALDAYLSPRNVAAGSPHHEET